MAKSGIVAATLFVKEICRVLRVWRPAIDAAITAAVGAGVITSTQQTELELWLSGAQSACDIIRLVSGY